MTDGILTTLMVGCLIGIIIAFGNLVSSCEQKFVDDSWRDIIANKGCAEYYLDEKNQRQWRWKDGATKN